MTDFLKRLLLVCLLALSAVPAYASVDTLWTRTYSLGAANALSACCELSEGGFAAVGYVLNGTVDDGLIMKIDPLGDTLWVRTFGSPTQGERLFDVEELASGNLVACGLAASGLFTMTVAYSPNGDQLWYHEFDPPSGTSQAAAVLPTDDGGFYLLSRKSVPNRDLDIWLFRCTETGDSLWSTTLGTSTTDVPDALLWGNDGRLEIFGSSRNPGNLIYDLLHLSADQSGAELGSTALGDSLNWETLAAACRDSASGDFIIAGEASDGQPRHGYAFKLDSEGSVVWEQHYTAGFNSEKIAGVAPYLEGGAFFAGWAGNSISTPRLWLFSVGVNGDTTWTWTGTQSGWAFEDLAKLSDGGFLACGKGLVNGIANGLVWRIAPPSGVSGVVRDRVTGEPVEGVRVRAAELPQYSLSDTLGRFTLSLPPGEYTIYTGGACFTGDTLHGIEVQANQNTLSDITVGVAHMTMEHTTINIVAENHVGNYADLLVRNSGSGDLVYSFETEPISPAGEWLSVVPASGRIVPGDSLSARVYANADTFDTGTFDYFGHLYLHTNSCPETLRVLDVLAVILDAGDVATLPTEFALYPSYPNPFNGATRIRFAIDHDAPVSLSVYNLNGQRVETLLESESMQQGQHEVVWNAEKLSSGIYFVRLQDASRALTQRLLYIR